MCHRSCRGITVSFVTHAKKAPESRLAKARNRTEGLRRTAPHHETARSRSSGKSSSSRANPRRRLPRVIAGVESVHLTMRSSESRAATPATKSERATSPACGQRRGWWSRREGGVGGQIGQGMPTAGTTGAARIRAAHRTPILISDPAPKRRASQDGGW